MFETKVWNEITLLEEYRKICDICGGWPKKEKLTKEYSDKDAKLEQEVYELETNLKIKETELFQLRKGEDEQNEMLEQNNRAKGQKVYFFSGLIQKTRESLSQSTENLETHLLRYYSVVVIVLMLLGDFYITLFILKDILKIEYRNNELVINILSGIIPLVFLVLIERFMDSPYFRRYLKRIQTLSMFVIGLILLVIYLLIVYMPFLNNLPFVVDLLRAILFVPLVVAAAITAKKVQKEYGFSFLFTPIKDILAIFLITLFNVFLLLEVGLDYIRKYLQKEKFESKIKKTVEEKVGDIKLALAEKSSLRTTLEQKLEDDINKLNEHYQTLINKLEEELKRINTEIADVQKGFESGFVSSRLDLRS